MSPVPSAPPLAPPAAAAGSADTPAFAFTALHVRIGLVAVGLLCLGLGRLNAWLRPEQAELATLWALAGLVLSALPVLFDSLVSLKADGFEATKYYMDQFVALAVLACLATGQYATGTIVAAILVIGQMLEEHTTLGVEEAVGALLRLARVRARRLHPGFSGETEEVDADHLRPGDRVQLRPGDTIPADGELLTGRTALDQSSITGESLPVDAGPGTRVFAGTVNLTGAATMLVRETGGQTVIGRVTAIVEEARTSRAPVMRLIDRYTRYYLPLVLMLAGLVLFFTGDAQRAIAVVIVATPCAFVLASPSAMIAALAVASRQGMLVKSPRFFEAARDLDTVVFDKTGTLTTGRLAVHGVQPAAGVSADDLLQGAARLCAHSNHPVARAVLAEARARGVTPADLAEIEEINGHGLRGGAWLAGRRVWLEEQGVEMPPAAAGAAPGDASTLWVAHDRRLLGVILLADAVREETAAAIAELRREGIEEFVMLTGDRSEAAEAIARDTGMMWHRAGCLPGEKLAEVRALQASGRRVLVIGDGANDAPALAAGDLSLAMGALGSDVAIRTADVALMGNDLRQLPRFLRLSRRTLALIHQNLLWGSAFILLFVALSALGFVNPITAAVLHEFSAFFVLFNSARLLRFDT